MKAIFNFTPKNAHQITHAIMGLLMQEDFITYIEGSIDKEQTIEISDTASKSEKIRMNRYLRGPLMKSVVSAYRDAGYQLDPASALIEMKMLFGKDLYESPITGDITLNLISIGDVTKERLLTFIVDVIQHLEEDLSWSVPDSKEYLNKLAAIK